MKQQRRFWQIHLSTAVVLTFVAGGLMWANMQPRPTEDWNELHKYVKSNPEVSMESVCFPGAFSDRGWPLTAHRTDQTWYLKPVTRFFLWESLLNFSAGIGIIIVVAVFMEYLILPPRGSHAMKRRWFQLHLSTAVVLVLVAGVMLGLNFPHQKYPDMPAYGYPYVCYEELTMVPQRYSESIRFYDPVVNIGPVTFHYADNGISYCLLAIDVAFAILILGGAGFVCEYLIRRREARMP